MGSDDRTAAGSSPDRIRSSVVPSRTAPQLHPKRFPCYCQTGGREQAKTEVHATASDDERGSGKAQLSGEGRLGSMKKLTFVNPARRCLVNRTPVMRETGRFPLRSRTWSADGRSLFFPE